ncbi:MAG: universal stress protein [Nitrospirae bacterium]|nr:universal stress protein [Nitrospirota bacterium]
MYKRILTAVNEHLNSEVTARYAMSLARVGGAKLYICFIAEKGQPTSVIERAEEAVKRIFISAEKAGISSEAITETGEPVRRISELVRQEGIDIVFASTRRADIQRRFFVETIAKRLSLNLPCSTAIVRVVHIGRLHPKEILLPLKARIDHIEERAYFAAKIAQAFDSKVFIFHSPKPISRFFHGEIHLSPLEWEEKLSVDMAHFMEHLSRYKVIHEKKFTPGRAGRAIAIEAASRRHDLIIMGESQRSLLSSILKGNPVEDMLRDTPSDLIIFNARMKTSHENT